MPGPLDNVRDVLGRLTMGQKIKLGMALVAILAVVWGVSLYGTRIRYGVLFTQIGVDDGNRIVAALRERNIPYRLSAGGTVIEVPVEQVTEARMELAGENLPSGGGIGFEIFDKPSFGLSDFVQNVNYRRALERELARTIQSLDSVQSARVHLALPPPSVFADEQREAGASVVVRLRDGGGLSAGEVRAVAHLVASGVEGLDPDRVSVIDGHGRMLSDGSGEAQPLSASQHEARKAVESGIESTLVAILEPVVGAGRVRARATVELNSTEVQRVEERYDPAGAVVRSEQKSRSRNGGGSGGGVPGTASNLPGEAPAAAVGASAREESQTSTTNFEINKTVSTIAEPVGSLLRQSVAVVVDNAVRSAPGAEGGDAPASSPRTAEEMRKITDLVRAAVGINEERGDVLIVENVPFEGSASHSADPGEPGIDWVHVVVQVARYGALPLAVLVIVLLVVRPGIAVLRSLRREPAGPAEPPTVAEVLGRIRQGELPGAGGRADLRRRLIEAAAENPDAAALVVRGWLGSGRGERS